MKSLPSKLEHADKKKTMVSFRMPTELHKELTNQAKIRGITLTQLMTIILDDAATELKKSSKAKR